MESFIQNRSFKIIIIASLLFLNVGCDQVSKAVVRNSIDYHDRISLFQSHLTLTKVENTGAFLGMGKSIPEFVRIFALIIIPILVMLYGVYFMIQKHVSNYTLLGLGFMIGGGIGNIFDRIVHGSVTDFLHIDFIIFETGIFNMADVSIMTGLFIMIIPMVIGAKPSNASNNKNM
ncbi:MAG: signal peptidase II [Cyclobacteriaceae bacterium]